MYGRNVFLLAETKNALCKSGASMYEPATYTSRTPSIGDQDSQLLDVPSPAVTTDDQ
jgi:hypothetical protein